MRSSNTFSATTALALAACLLASCGGDDSSSGLSRERAADLRASLDAIESRVDRNDCSGATAQANAFAQEVASLPSRVDSGLRDALRGSATRLESLVADQCTAQTQEEPQVEEPPPEEQTGGDQGKDGKQDKPEKPKKEKDEPPPDEGTTGATGVTGTTGATGVTGNGGATIPEGGG
jgi:hypothetical protein